MEVPVTCMISLPKMKPWCKPCVAVEYPDRCFLFAPSTCMRPGHKSASNQIQHIAASKLGHPRMPGHTGQVTGSLLTWTLQAGILERLVRPPAMPMSLAAISVPTAADRLGAMWCIFICTSLRISALSLSSCSATSQACSSFFRLSSDSGCPAVVDAVTDTTMTVACMGDHA